MDETENIEYGIMRHYIDIFGDEIFHSDKFDFLKTYLNKKGFNYDSTMLLDKLKTNVGVYQKEKEIRKMEERLAGRRTLKDEISIECTDNMTGEEFELYVSNIFTRMGYIIEITKHSGDQGVDIIAKKNGDITAIQAKCYSNSVGNSAVQEVIAGKQYYKADKGMVITNNYFTFSAKELAKSTGTILWDRDKLEEMIKLLY